MMKTTSKWIVALLLLSLIAALMISCNQTPDPQPPTPGGSNSGEQTTEGSAVEQPVTEYGNFTSAGEMLSPDRVFAQDVEAAEATFGRGSTYDESKLANVFQITDYIANYKKYVEEYGVQDQLDQLYEETGFTLDMGFAADMMKHYIGATGENYDFSATVPELLESAKISAAQATSISAAMVAAENLVKSGESGVSINQKTHMRFTSLKASDGPAYYALGNFSTMTDLSDVQRNGDTLTATVTFRIVDFYDWSPHDTEPLFTDVLRELDDTYRTLLGEMVDMPTLEGFCQADMAQLHNAGYAQSFLSSGTVVYTVTWTAGQSFDQATVQPVGQ